MKDDNDRSTAQNVLAYVLDNILRLLHPFVPFITEVIFQKLNEIVPKRILKGLVEPSDSDALVVADWPDTDLSQSFVDEKVESQILTIQNVIRSIRDIRSKYNRKPSEKMTASANAPADIAEYINNNSGLVCQLAGLNDFKVSPEETKPQNSAAGVIGQMQIYLHNAVDVDAERKRLEKQKEQIEKAKNATQAKLSNENFVNKAKPEVVNQAKEKLSQLTEQLDIIDKHLSELKL
jgi:valyl-tRNA synthetase